MVVGPAHALMWCGQPFEAGQDKYRNEVSWRVLRMLDVRSLGELEVQERHVEELLLTLRVSVWQIISHAEHSCNGCGNAEELLKVTGYTAHLSNEAVTLVMELGVAFSFFFFFSFFSPV